MTDLECIEHAVRHVLEECGKRSHVIAAATGFRWFQEGLAEARDVQKKEHEDLAKRTTFVRPAPLTIEDDRACGWNEHDESALRKLPSIVHITELAEDKGPKPYHGLTPPKDTRWISDADRRIARMAERESDLQKLLAIPLGVPPVTVLPGRKVDSDWDKPLTKAEEDILQERRALARGATPMAPLGDGRQRQVFGRDALPRDALPEAQGGKPAAFSDTLARDKARANEGWRPCLTSSDEWDIEECMVRHCTARYQHVFRHKSKHPRAPGYELGWLDGMPEGYAVKSNEYGYVCVDHVDATTPCVM